MNIVILGAGNLGSYVAAILTEEEHNVTLIDQDSKTLEKISREIDIATIQGHGADWKLLEDLIETEPDLFIAMTGHDETNLVTCSMAKNIGFPKTIARVQEIGYLSRSRFDFGRLFFVDHFIAAEVLAAHDILKSVISEGDISVENFAHGAIQMRTITIPESWNRPNSPISELMLPEEMVIGIIRRKIIVEKEEKDQIIFPHGEDHILPGDEVTIIGESKVMYNLHETFGTSKIVLKSIVIIGGSNVTLHLSRVLEKQNIAVRIIEKNDKRCERLADLLPQSTIINNDGRNLSFLISEKVKDADYFITCTTNDETNLLTAALGKQAGCDKVIALISDDGLGPVLRQLNITSSVSERVNIANRILSIVHEETIISIGSLCDNRARVLEIKVSPDSELVGIPISDLSVHLPKDLIIAVIESKGKVMIGKGNRILSPSDTVIVISSPKHLQELQHLF